MESSGAQRREACGVGEGDPNLTLTLTLTLRKEAYLMKPYPRTEKDLERRGLAYLNGYFKALRHFVLTTGFNLLTQFALLAMAEIRVAKIPDPDRKRQWMFHIKQDREMIRSSMSQ